MWTIEQLWPWGWRVATQCASFAEAERVVATIRDLCDEHRLPCHVRIVEANHV